MTCHETRELYSALIDDALTPTERGELEAHVAGCAECRRELDRFRQTVALVQGIAPERAPAGFVDRVLEAATPWHRRLARRLFSPIRVKVPLQAAAVLVVGVAAVYVFQHTPELQQAARQDSPPPAIAPAPPSVSTPAPVQTLAKPSRKAASDGPGSAPGATSGAPPSAEPSARPGGASAPHESQSSPAPAGAERKAPAEADQGASANRAPDPAAAKETGARAEKKQEVGREGQATEPRADVGGAAQSALSAPAQGQVSMSAPAPGVKPLIATPPAVTSPTPGSEPGLSREPAKTDALEGRLQAPRDTGKDAPRAKRENALRSASLRGPDVIGRLVVADREPALRGLGGLLMRVGGQEVGRRAEGDATVVEVLVPRERYVEFGQGLGQLGRWTTSGEPTDLPAQVLIALRIGG